MTAFETNAPNLLSGSTTGEDGVIVVASNVLPPAAAGRPRITRPVDFSQFVLPATITFAWTAVEGAERYGFEHTGQSVQFANPNGTEADPLNGLGGAGGAFLFDATGFTTTVAGLPAGSYQVRVIGLSAGNQVLGTFSDAVTLILGDVGTAVPATVHPTIVAPTNNSVLARGSSVTFEWTALVGADSYVFEFTGPGGQFAIPNATTLTDPGAAGRMAVAGTSIQALVPPGMPPGAYQVRLIGLTATSLPAGSFSDAVTLVVQ